MSPLSASRGSAGLLFVLLFGASAALAEPTTIHLVRERISYDDTASKFTYLGNYSCFFSKYWAELAEPEPQRTQIAKQRALASTPPVSSYSAADRGEVEEYFAPGRYARYERSTTFVPSGHGGCALERVDETKVQLAQGTRLINATTKNGITKVSEIPPPHEATTQETQQAGAVLAQVAPAWGGGLAPGTVSKVGEEIVAGQPCELMSSSASTFGMAVTLCVWRGVKSFATPLGPKDIVLFLETRSSAPTPATKVTDPIVVDTGEVLHWTERATAFQLNEAFADAVFAPPQPNPSGRPR